MPKLVKLSFVDAADHIIKFFWLASAFLGIPLGMILTWGSVFLAVFALNVFQRGGK